MSELIRVPCFPSINLVETTQLDADVAAGATQATLFSPLGFQSSGHILLGNRGAENTEVVTISLLAGNVLSFSSTPARNLHRQFEEVTRLFGDRVNLYRAANVDGTTPDDSAFTLIQYASIQGDDLTVDISDPTGSSSYWYKTTFYNTLTLEESSLASSVATRGASYGRLASIESIKAEAGLLGNDQIGDPRIAEIRETSEGEVLARIAAAGYTLPLQTDTGRLFTPPVVEAMARILSAGRLLSQEFAGSDEDTKNGYKKIKDVQGMFDALLKNELLLLDDTGAVMGRSTTDVSGWPDDTTASVGTDGTPEPFQMRMSKEF